MDNWLKSMVSPGCATFSMMSGSESVPESLQFLTVRIWLGIRAGELGTNVTFGSAGSVAAACSAQSTVDSATETAIASARVDGTRECQGLTARVSSTRCVACMA